MKDEEQIREILIKFGQEHLIRFWDELTETEREALLNDIYTSNLEETVKFFEKVTQANDNMEKLNFSMEPLPSTLHGSLSNTDAETLNLYKCNGLKQISNGSVGVLLLAGGQGTRLGVDFPKGMFDVGLPSKKSLFQLQAERILKLQSLAQEKYSKSCIIPWYIMTSPATSKATAQFFQEHNYFRLDKNNVVMFEQGVLPCFDFEGKILMENKFKIAKAPDGNGGLYRALKEKNILQDMDRRKIEYLHVYCVDNILVKVADPTFIGYCVAKGAECAAKVVEKTVPTEPIGVVCKVGEKIQVVEYSEISKEVAHKCNKDEKLVFNAGNICNHFFTKEFLKNVANQFESQMKLHKAKKKIPHINIEGKFITPDKPNGVKIEKFIFDVFPFASNSKFVTWEVPREDEFSALKNSTDSKEDNPATARNSIFKLHKKYAEKAGGVVTFNGEFEISPLLSYEGEGLETVCKGRIFNEPFYLYDAKDEMYQNGCH